MSASDAGRLSGSPRLTREGGGCRRSPPPIERGVTRGLLVSACVLESVRCAFVPAAAPPWARAAGG
eukprot:7950421-Pyramimonas_sp.AAC.1